jgi:hypothetical protein
MPKLLWTKKQDIGPTARMDHAVAYDASRHRVVLFGGRGLGWLALSDTWAWNGEFWTELEDIGPSARAMHAMAFDSARERVVLFGGLDASGSASPTVFADTWEWDGALWTQVADTGPSARYGHAMAFNSKIKRVVLFGGLKSGDTWSWDGTEWTQDQDTGPGARSGHALAYDTIHDRVVLFGGSGLVSANKWEHLPDTWEWDGSEWSQVADIGPAPRLGHRMVFEGTRVHLFGGTTGLSGSADFGDTWGWDGKRWTQLQDIGPARAYAGMAHDNDRGRTVLFGGGTQDPNSPLVGDTWELYEHI